MTIERFPDLVPGEKRVLTFDMTADLEVGETLTGTPTVTVSLVAGTDATPSSILSGAATLDGTSKKILQVVDVSIDGVEYCITAISTTSNSNKDIGLSGHLRVQRC